MTSADVPPDEPMEEPEEGWFIDESVTDAPLQADQEARFLDKVRPRIAASSVFYGLLLLALLLHGVIIAAFLYRDAHAPMQLAQTQETPVEIVVEKPPEPEKPKPVEPPKPEPPKPPPPPPEPPKPKEDLSPAMSAPRAPTENKVKTETKEAKTAAPTKQDEPTKGQPKEAPAASAPPKEAAPAETKQPTAPAETKKEETAKEEDKKPDAEALDKARKAAAKAQKAKEAKVKEAKAAQKRKAMPNALAALAGAPQLDMQMSFAKPTPKTKIFGGTEDVRWMSIVEAELEAKVQKLPQTAHWRDGGRVVIFFHVDVSGRVISHDIIIKSGYPDIDAIAMRALNAAAPFPPPPPGLERGLYWASTFDGVIPKLHISKK